jgi:hypothetical protein
MTHSKTSLANKATSLSTLFGFCIGKLRDDTLDEIDEIESWINEIVCKSKNKSIQEKKNRCEVCNSKEEPYNLELHHIAGRKHDYRTITIDKKCHHELSESQKTWDGRWLQKDQPENVRLGFLLMGIHDILMLKGRNTRSSAYEELARKLRQRIYQSLNLEEENYA